MPEIIWRGTVNTNKSLRNQNIPIAIVNHITEGTWQSCDEWFNDKNNTGSSAHFCIARDGSIRQYVRIEDCAWANGITAARFKYVTSKLVKEKGTGISVNRYTVSIEHEGYDGCLTEEQFQSSVWLHKYIREYVKKTWGYEIPFDREHIIGHYEIDAINRPYCPGIKFPWDRLMKELTGGISMEDLRKVLNIPDASWAKEQIELMKKNGLINSDHDTEEIITFGILATVLNNHYKKVMDAINDIKVKNGLK